jgi:5'-nucleotidase
MERMIIDMDEVIADPMGDMINWFENKYALGVDYEKMKVGSWLAGFPEQYHQEVRERLHGPGFFRHLPVMEDSVDVLKEINNKYELFIVSAATEFPNSLKEKMDWLGDHFPFISWRQVVLCGDKRMINGDHMIDDHVRNLIHFPGKKYLFSTPHNFDIQEYTRINNWKEAAAILL